MAVLAAVMASAHVEAPQTAPAGGQEFGLTGAAFGGGADAIGGADVPAVDGVTPCSLLQAARRTAIASKTMMTGARKAPLGTCMFFSLLAGNYGIHTLQSVIEKARRHDR